MTDRFFIDHGVIHDRETGKHVRTGGNVEGSAEDGIEECCRLLNSLTHDELVAELERANNRARQAQEDYVGIQRALKSAREDATRCVKCRAPHDGTQWSTCEHCSVARTKFIGELESLLLFTDGRIPTPEEMLDQIRDIIISGTAMSAEMEELRALLREARMYCMGSDCTTQEIMKRIDGALGPTHVR